MANVKINDEANLAGELFSSTTSEDASTSEKRLDFNEAMAARIINLLSDKDRVKRMSMFALTDAFDILDGKRKRQGVAERGAPPFFSQKADKDIAENQTINSPSPSDLGDATAFDDALAALDASNRFVGEKKSARGSDVGSAADCGSVDGSEIAVDSIVESGNHQCLQGDFASGSKFESKTAGEIDVALGSPLAVDAAEITPPQGAGGPPGASRAGGLTLNAFVKPQGGDIHG